MPLYQRFPFAGWIPNASGRLSFRQIGETLHPTRSVSVNFKTKNARHIIAFQKRNLSDSLFSGITDLVSGRTGSFWFMIIGSDISQNARGSNKVNGSVLIFSTKQSWKRHKNIIRQSMNDIRQSILSADLDRAHLQFRAAKRICYAAADIKSCFQIFRNGEFFISSPRFRDTKIEDQSSKYAAEKGHDFRYWIANQMYFFIRDICHNHQHHEANTDTVIVLQERDSFDTRWRENIIYSLFHFVVKLRRENDERHLNQALGILAYADAYIGITGLKNSPNLSYQRQALTSSISAKIGEIVAIDRKMDSARSISNSHRALYFGFWAILFAIIAMLVQPQVSKDNRDRYVTLNYLSEWFALYVGELLVIFVSLSLLFWYYSRIKYNSKFMRDILIFAQYNLKWSMTVFLIFLMISCYLILQGFIIVMNYV